MNRPHCDLCDKTIADHHRTWVEMPSSSKVFHIRITSAKNEADLCDECYNRILTEHVAQNEVKRERSR